MSRGIVFDIQEFCVQDGPGPRISVFLKGCPLRCRWCHNPEGLSPRPQLMRGASCVKCGACASAEELLNEGRAEQIPGICPMRCLRVAGREYEAEELAASLMKYQDSLECMGGGITVSGGECLMQSDFTEELLFHLRGIHRAIETSGFAKAEDFQKVARQTELIMMDVKLMDEQAHRYWTGVSNRQIQENLSWLLEQDLPFIIRIPLIPGVNDVKENLEATARKIAGAPSLIRVELLPYNRNAGAKYEMLGVPYEPGFSEDVDPMTEHKHIFEAYNIPVIVL